MKKLIGIILIIGSFFSIASSSYLPTNHDDVVIEHLSTLFLEKIEISPEKADIYINTLKIIAVKYEKQQARISYFCTKIAQLIEKKINQEVSNSCFGFGTIQDLDNFGDKDDYTIFVERVDILEDKHYLRSQTELKQLIMEINIQINNEVQIDSLHFMENMAKYSIITNADSDINTEANYGTGLSTQANLYKKDVNNRYVLLETINDDGWGSLNQLDFSFDNGLFYQNGDIVSFKLVVDINPEMYGYVFNRGLEGIGMTSSSSTPLYNRGGRPEGGLKSQCIFVEKE